LQKPWLNNYHPSTPKEINPDLYKNLGEILTAAAKKYPQNKAVTCLGTSLSFQEIDVLANHFAAYLQQCGLKKGDRFAIMLPNTPQYLIALFAAFRLGLITVNINPLYTARELEFQLRDSNSESILILENFAHNLEAALPNLNMKNIIITKLGDFMPFFKRSFVNLAVKYIKKMVPSYHLPTHTPFLKALKIGKTLKLCPEEVNGSDIAFLQYTGGTTGIPKGAILTHRNVMANVQQGKSFAIGFLKEGTGAFILPLPIYHIYALTLSLFLIESGKEDVLIVNPRDLPTLVETLKHTKYEGFIGLNTLFHALIHYEPFKKLKFPEKFYTIAGGMSTKETVAKEWQKVTGSPVIEGYGLSETSPIVTLNRFDLKEYNGTVGYPLPNVDVTILDDAGKSVPMGEIGELCVKGPNVMQGYWMKPEETANVFTKDGWMKTGDIVLMEKDGKIKIMDRKKDMIIVSGFNVYPNEVEEVLLFHPAIKEACVVGVADEHSGEKVKAFIVAKDDSLTEKQVMDHVHQYLTGYKRPHIIEFRKELPKSAVGKVLRLKLRESG
jgi:long-chain acyl-CoA synthetase